MSTPPPKLLSNTSTFGEFTPDKGFTQQQTITRYATAPYPILNPPTLIGVDFVTQTVTNGDIITFPNLPVRGSGLPISGTQNQPQTIAINPGDLLMYEVSAQGSVIATGRALDTNNVVYPAPFLGPGTYKAFQAVISSASPVSATIVGKLYLQRGS